MSSRSVNIFPPQMEAMQPAFVSSCTISFQTSVELIEDSNVIYYKIVDPNQKSAYGTNIVATGSVPSWMKDTKINNKYSISFTPTGLTTNQYYQVFLSFDRINFSRPTYIRPIATPQLNIVTTGGIYDHLFTIEGNLLDPSEPIRYIEIEGYVPKTLVNDGTFKFSFYLKQQGSNTLRLKYETLHGWKSSVQSISHYNTPTQTGNSLNVPQVSKEEAGIKLSSLNPVNTILERAPANKNQWQVLTENFTQEQGYVDWTCDLNTNYRYRVRSKTEPIQASGQTTPISLNSDHILLNNNNNILLVKYNPSVSNVKYITQESVVNTLGGRYPLIRKSGDTRYKQFNLNGTIYGNLSNSLESQSSSIKDIVLQSYIASESPSLYVQNTIAFSSNKEQAERETRQYIVDFLTDGRPKLFRSTEEGTMIVYLSNISFTPNKTLGRSVWDFSATVTEFCEYSEENVKKYNLIPPFTLVAASYQKEVEINDSSLSIFN